MPLGSTAYSFEQSRPYFKHQRFVSPNTSVVGLGRPLPPSPRRRSQCAPPGPQRRCRSSSCTIVARASLGSTATFSTLGIICPANAACWRCSLANASAIRAPMSSGSNLPASGPGNVTGENLRARSANPPQAGRRARPHARRERHAGVLQMLRILVQRARARRAPCRGPERTSRRWPARSELQPSRTPAGVSDAGCAARPRRQSIESLASQRSSSECAEAA